MRRRLGTRLYTNEWADTEGTYYLLLTFGRIVTNLDVAFFGMFLMLITVDWEIFTVKIISR